MKQTVPVDAEAISLTSNRVSTSVRMLTVVCAIVTVVALFMACDIGMFVLAARPASRLADPPRISKLLVVLALSVLIGVVFSIAARRLMRGASAYLERVVGWSPGWIIFWTSLAFLFWGIYYPLPYHSHHIDKVLLGMSTGLMWGIGFLVSPRHLATLTNGRGYSAAKVVVVNILIFVMVGEVVVRLVDPYLARAGLFAHSDTPARLKPHVPMPGSVRFTNSQGFRDRERNSTKAEGSLRILALGDSFTYEGGVSYDDNFVTLQEQGLTDLGRPAEVINLGVPGWAPAEEFHLLKMYGITLDPDIVMVNLFVGNDIMKRRETYLERPIVVAGQSYYVHVTGNWLHDTFSPDRWYLYHSLNYLIKVGGGIGWSKVFGEPIDPAREWVPFRSYHAYLRDIDDRSEIYRNEESALFQFHWSRTQETLNAMHQFLKMRGVSLVLVLLPAQEQVDPVLQEDLLRAVQGERGGYDFEKPQRLLRQGASEHDVFVIDLLPAFQGYPDPSALYFENDIHWTRTGHRLAADSILPLLRSYLTDSQLHGHS